MQRHEKLFDGSLLLLYWYQCTGNRKLHSLNVFVDVYRYRYHTQESCVVNKVDSRGRPLFHSIPTRQIYPDISLNSRPLSLSLSHHYFTLPALLHLLKYTHSTYLHQYLVSMYYYLLAFSPPVPVRGRLHLVHFSEGACLRMSFAFECL